ncbi:MFS transporter [Intestinimonas sp.]|uniref:MFS transporter n=1 Tax=Intestinimonas sp. TaxID=1965293 RepID=UPI002619AEEE|nr:MFS transporter [Intestinimonas sp.]
MTVTWKRQFAVLWLGQAVSILTSSISQYALIWDLTARTGSAAVLSLAAMAALLPQGVFSLFTGAVADRFDRRKIMALADGAIGLVSLALAAGWRLAGELPISAILAVLALRSVGSAFHAPCLQAVTPLLVPRERLSQCAGWSQGVQTLSLLLSPALAALLYAAVPLPLIIALDALGAAFAIGFLLLARLPALRTGREGPFRLLDDCRAGCALLRSQGWLWQLCLICGIFSVAVVPVSSLFPLMCMNYFGGTAVSASVVETAYSLGMLAGSLLLGLWGGTRNKMTAMTAALFAMGGCLLAVGGLSPAAFLAFTGLALGMGLASPFFNSMFTALIQEKVAGDYLGRVLGLTSAVMTLAGPVGLAATALFAERVGLVRWFVLAGGLTALCGVLCLVLPAVRRCDGEKERVCPEG